MATRTNRSLADLQSEIAALQKQATEMRQREVLQVVDQIKKAIAAYGLSAADLDLAAKRGPAAKRNELPQQPKTVSTRAAKPAAKGSKIAPKYKDESGNTWAGRGLKPRWLTAALKAGRKIEEFTI